MNNGIIRYILGKILIIEGGLLILPFIVGLIYGEEERRAFLPAILACLVIGFLFSFKKPEDNVFYLKEGCVVTALSWILLSLFGALPFIITGEIPSFTDAVFETASGFTTTGASILSDVEALSHASLFWRSFTHWIGGMGILVFMLAIIPLTGGGSNFNLMRAESPGPSVSKLAPKLKSTAQVLYRIYIVLTVIEFLLLIIFKMPVFDAITLTLGTAGTGGFGIKNSSVADYSVACQWIITIFMLLFGVNFNAYFFIFLRQFRKAFSMEEVRVYILSVLASIAAITICIFKSCNGLFDAITKASFQVVSIVTTTGYSTVDFDLWPAFPKYVLVLLMFMGACAGSTGGGIKVSRFCILIKTFLKETLSYIHPKSIKKIDFDKKPIDHDTVRATNVYMVNFLIIFVVSGLLVSLDDQDLITTFTAVAATINNIGPGLSAVGPTCNFALFSPGVKWVLIFDMLAGRLELFPILILFHPGVLKDVVLTFTHTHHKKVNHKL